MKSELCLYIDRVTPLSASHKKPACATESLQNRSRNAFQTLIYSVS
jgi:hypothetical protein